VAKKKRTRSNGGMSKTAAVQTVMAMGITKPIPISQKVLEKFGIEVRPTHVSAIKSQLKKKGPAPGGERSSNGVGNATFGAAVEYVRRVGGLERAEEGLKMIRTAREL
jgi:hypothetical protein